MAEDTRSRSDLKGALEGKHVIFDTDLITMGFFEDLESSRTGQQLDALVSVIVGGDLPAGIDKAGLRKLKPPAFSALCDGLSETLTIKKGI